MDTPVLWWQGISLSHQAGGGGDLFSCYDWALIWEPARHHRWTVFFSFSFFLLPVSCMAH